MAQFVIQSLTEKDIPAILKVYQDCEDFLALGPQPVASVEMVMYDIKEAQTLGGVFMGIFSPIESVSGKKMKAQQLMGVLSYIASGFEGKPDQAFILLLMVAAQFRNQGLGGAVVAWLEDQLHQESTVTRVQSGVQVNNPKAIRFWQRQGYQIIGPAQLFPDTTTALPLEKKLI